MSEHFSVNFIPLFLTTAVLDLIPGGILSPGIVPFNNNFMNNIHIFTKYRYFFFTIIIGVVLFSVISYKNTDEYKATHLNTSIHYDLNPKDLISEGNNFAIYQVETVGESIVEGRPWLSTFVFVNNSIQIGSFKFNHRESDPVLRVGTVTANSATLVTSQPTIDETTTEFIPQILRLNLKTKKIESDQAIGYYMRTLANNQMAFETRGKVRLYDETGLVWQIDLTLIPDSEGFRFFPIDIAISSEEKTLGVVYNLSLAGATDGQDYDKIKSRLLKLDLTTFETTEIKRFNYSDHYPENFPFLQYPTKIIFDANGEPSVKLN